MESGGCGRFLANMRKARTKPLTAKQRAELAALARLGDAAIDTREMPEVRDWSGAERGRFRTCLAGDRGGWEP